MRSTSRPGSSRCIARSWSARRCAETSEVLERVVGDVRASVGGVRVVADLALGGPVAERPDIELAGGAAVAGETGAVDARDHHHAVRRSPGAVGRGRVVGALRGDGVDEAAADLDDVEREHAERRARELGRELGRERAQLRERLAERGPELVEHVARDVGDGVEHVEARVERLARSVADPAADVARRARPTPPTIGTSSPQPSPSSFAAAPLSSAVPAGTGRCNEAWSSRRSSAGVHGCSSTPPVGNEMHELGEVVGAEEQHRVDVAVADAHTEVQDGPAVVVVACRPTRPDDVVARDGLALVHRDRLQERVRRAERAAVRDRDVQRARDRRPRT